MHNYPLLVLCGFWMLLKMLFMVWKIFRKWGLIQDMPHSGKDIFVYLL